MVRGAPRCRGAPLSRRVSSTVPRAAWAPRDRLAARRTVARPMSLPPPRTTTDCTEPRASFTLTLSLGGRPREGARPRGGGRRAGPGGGTDRSAAPARGRAGRGRPATARDGGTSRPAPLGAAGNLWRGRRAPRRLPPAHRGRRVTPPGRASLSVRRGPR